MGSAECRRARPVSGASGYFNPSSIDVDDAHPLHRVNWSVLSPAIGLRRTTVNVLHLDKTFRKIEIKEDTIRADPLSPCGVLVVPHVGYSLKRVFSQLIKSGNDPSSILIHFFKEFQSNTTVLLYRHFVYPFYHQCLDPLDILSTPS